MDIENESLAARIRRQQTDMAIAETNERLAKRRRVEAALRIDRDRREQLGEVIELAPDVVVAEIVGGHFGTSWRHVINGNAKTEAFMSRWEAVLDAIGTFHGAGQGAGMFAARVLLVPTDTE